MLETHYFSFTCCNQGCPFESSRLANLNDAYCLLSMEEVHSDRGSRYCGHLVQSTLKAYGMRSSMSRKGDCWHDAPTESLWESLKQACVYGQRFTTREQAQAAVMNWLAFYNATRLHSRLGYVSPMQFEKTGLQNRQGVLLNRIGYGIRNSRARSHKLPEETWLHDLAML
jgi:hypothetical protein